MQKYFLTILFLFFVAPAWALDTGLVIGAGQSNIDSDLSSLQSNEMGSRIGVNLKFLFSDVIDFRTGFLYSLRKYQYPNFYTDPLTSNTVQENLEVQMGYLSIPLLAQLNLSSTFVLFAGPVYEINVMDKVKSNVNGDGVVDGESTSNFLGQVGVGLNLWGIEFDLIYEKGFTNVYKGTDGKWDYIGLNVVYWLNPVESYNSYSF